MHTYLRLTGECIRESADERCFKWNEVSQCIFTDEVMSGEKPRMDNIGGGNGNKPDMGNNGGGNGNKPDMGNNGGGIGGGIFGDIKRGAIQTCTQEYVECKKERIQEDIASLPECARETLANLATCALSNAETCAGSCEAQRNITQGRLSLPSNFNPQSLKRCGPVRSRIFRPLCGRLSCCTECYEALEAVTTCFLEEVVQVLPRNGTCSSDCSNDADAASEDGEDEEEEDGEDSRRRLLQQEESLGLLDSADQVEYTEEAQEMVRDARHLLEVNIEDSIFQACIELAPGVNPNARGDPLELANQLEFFDCVMDNVVDVVTDESLVIDNSDEDSGPEEGGTGPKDEDAMIDSIGDAGSSMATKKSAHWITLCTLTVSGLALVC